MISPLYCIFWQRKFSLPQLSGVDDVLFAMFGVKVRYTKHRFKKKLFRLAVQRLDEANNVGINGAQEGTYTEDELLQALDLIDPPPNFLNHQWELYKSNLRAPMAKVPVCFPHINKLLLSSVLY